MTVEQVRMVVEASGVSASAIARELKMSHAWLSLRLNGKRPCDASLLVKVLGIVDRMVAERDAAFAEAKAQLVAPGTPA